MNDIAKTHTPDLRVAGVKAFVPAADFALSRRFYAAIGFEMVWSSDALALFRHGDASFLLQNFHVAEHTANFMMHLLVHDVDAWWRQLQDKRIAEEFIVKIGTPDDQPWGQRDFTLFDPSGVLWRIAQDIA
jgi:uncharacterized glyoxalase superfamily protein PhnB